MRHTALRFTINSQEIYSLNLILLQEFPTQTSTLSFAAVCVTLQFVIPSILISGAYFRVYRYLKGNQGAMDSSPEAFVSHTQIRRNVRRNRHGI